MRPCSICGLLVLSAPVAVYLMPLLPELLARSQDPYTGGTTASWLSRLHHDDATDRAAAVYALERWAAEADVQAALLGALRDDPDANVRTAAASALARGGPSAADGLRQALGDSSRLTRMNSARSLGRLNVTDAVTLRALAGLAESDPELEVRMQAINALAKAGAHARSALPMLRRARGEADGIFRDVADRAIRNIESE